MLQELSLHNPNDEGCTLARGVIHHQIKIWLGSHREAHDAVLHALHNSAIGGHFGVEDTFQRVCSLLSWSRMRQDVHRFIQTCQILQQEKDEHVKSPGLLQPLSYGLHPGTPLPWTSSRNYHCLKSSRRFWWW